MIKIKGANLILNSIGIEDVTIETGDENKETDITTSGNNFCGVSKLILREIIIFSTKVKPVVYRSSIHLFVCSSVCLIVNFPHFHFILNNYWASPKLCTKHPRHLKIFFSIGTGPNATSQQC